MSSNCMPSKVYVMQGSGCVKVGRSANPIQRAKTISATYPGGVTLRYETSILKNGSYVEALAHQNLARHKISREWFSCGVEDAIQAIEAALEWAGPGVSGFFTMQMDSDLLRELKELAGDQPVQRYVENILRSWVPTRGFPE